MNGFLVAAMLALVSFVSLPASAEEACGTKSLGPVTSNLTLQSADFSDPWSGECVHEILMVTANNHVVITLPPNADVKTVFMSIVHGSTNGSFTVVTAPSDGGQILATMFTTRGRFGNFESSSSFRRWYRID